MQTERLSVHHPEALSRALSVLQNGMVVAFPTDTVYGLGALAFDTQAIESIYAIKDRPAEKAIPILIGDLHDLNKVAISLPPMAAKLAARFWPGPLTLVVPKNPALPEIVSTAPTVGVRIPDHPIARALLKAAGPMAVTSANRSGQPSPTTAEEVMQQLNGRIPLVLDGGETPGGLSSTVVDCLGPEPVILRAGPIFWEEIAFVLA